MTKLIDTQFLILLLLFLLVSCGTSGTEVETSSMNEVETVAEVTTDDTGTAISDSAVIETSNDDAVVMVAENDAVEESADTVRPDGWSETTHSNDADPNYAVVFPEDAVNSMTITIAPEDWQAMLDNMTELYGEPSGNGGGGAGGGRNAGDPPAGEVVPPDGGVPPADGAVGERPPRPEGGGRPGGGGGPVANFATENPDYVAATIEFEGDVWTNVGVRFKGNSTLRNAWNSGSLELPFKLDFDEFEDDYPEIDDQRFYGFKQLSLQSPSADNSYVRAPLAYDVLQAAGLMAPETAWYELFVDYGEGPVSFGVYTVIEVIDDSVIDTALGDDDGNIYEGDGTGVTLAEGTFDQIADSFQKENNDENDYSDLEALYNALHADTRLTNSDQWRSDLEAVFDVDTFLHWLAVNSVIVNWDTYGQMTHNFYLYHDPETDLLTWIGWDYNESLQEGRRGGTASLDQAGVTDQWPLIRYLLDEPTYYEQYVAHVAEVEAGAFSAEAITAKLQAWETLLTPYLSDSTTFTNQIDTITNFVTERNNVVEAFLTDN